MFVVFKRVFPWWHGQQMIWQLLSKCALISSMWSADLDWIGTVCILVVPMLSWQPSYLPCVGAVLQNEGPCRQALQPSPHRILKCGISYPSDPHEWILDPLEPFCLLVPEQDTSKTRMLVKCVSCCTNMSCRVQEYCKKLDCGVHTVVALHSRACINWSLRRALTKLLKTLQSTAARWKRYA